MIRETIIYLLLDPDGSPRYVGKTSQDPRKRLSNHISNARRGTRRPVANWARKRIVEGFLPHLVVVEEVPAGGDWAAAETRWISELRAIYGRALLNLSAGGEAGALGVVRSDRYKKLMSDRNRGKVISDDQRNKLRLAGLGKRHSLEVRAKIGASQKGRKCPPRTPEHCAAIGRAKLGHQPILTAEQETRRRENLPRGESHVRSRLTEAKVQQILLSAESLNVLARKLGVSRSLVHLVRKRQIWAHVQVPGLRSGPLPVADGLPRAA